MSVGVSAAFPPRDLALFRPAEWVMRTKAQYDAISDAWEISANEDPPHQTRLRAVRGNDTFIAEAVGTAVCLRRREHQLERMPDWVVLAMPSQGSLVIHQGSSTVVSAGEAGCVDFGREFTITTRPQTKVILVYVPAGSLRRRGVWCKDKGTKKWQGSPLLSSLRVMAQEILESPLYVNGYPGEGVLFEIVVSLLATHMNGSVDVTTAGQRLRRLDSLIGKHFPDPDLSPGWLADELGMSLRALYELVAPVGVAVGSMVRFRRIQCAQSFLRDRLDLSVSEVAQLCGFRGPDQFTRAFRAENGMTPSAFRATVSTP